MSEERTGDSIEVGRYRALAWTDEHVRRFWEYESQFPENYFSYGYRNKIVPRLRGALNGMSRVLDFGCGGGFLIPAIAQVADEVYGMDFSARSVELTNARNVEVSGFKGAYEPNELLSMGLEFDAILSVEVIEHLSDAQLESSIELVTELLGPEGVLVVTTPNDEDLAAARLYCPQCDQVFHRWQHVRSWTADTLGAFLSNRGFEDVRTWTTDFSPPLGLGAWGQVRRLARALVGASDPGLPHLVGVAKRP